MVLVWLKKKDKSERKKKNIKKKKRILVQLQMSERKTSTEV
jgi:hypothetical protein